MKIRRTSFWARAFFLLHDEGSRSEPVTLCYMMATIFIGLPLVGILLLAASPIVLIGGGAEWLGAVISRRWARWRGGLPQESRPSVLMEWARAKKRRICPLVEFD